MAASWAALKYVNPVLNPHAGAAFGGLKDAQILAGFLEPYHLISLSRFSPRDLPLKFHPVAVRVSADVTPFGAV
ncbi:hypothetical protein ACVWZ3_010622 [Bradyrhizobium sp. i1.3.6]